MELPMEALAFYIFAVLAVVSAAVVTLPVVRGAVTCALALVFNLVSIAAMFFLLNAQFIGFLQVIVYAGAIMVLILFVIMLLNMRDEQSFRTSGLFQRVLAPLLALGFVGLLASTIARSTRGMGSFPDSSAGFGTVRALGQDLFTRFFYPFEAISLLLVVAMIGAVLLSKRRL